MFTYARSRRSAALLMLLGALSLGTAMAQDRGHDHDRRDARREMVRDSRGYVLDARYNHNRYYPPRGRVVSVVPRGAYVVRRAGVPYYYHGGIWYRPSGPRFMVVAPPIGLFVGGLPPYYSRIWVGGVPYYYADDVYYRRERDGYIVVDPPNDGDVSTEGPPDAASLSASDELFIYPKSGQSEQQQARDRYECHSWASGQTGFDPTQQSGGVSESQAAAKRADYHRAMTACLEARGYSVR